MLYEVITLGEDGTRASDPLHSLAHVLLGHRRRLLAAVVDPGLHLALERKRRRGEAGPVRHAGVLAERNNFV